MTLDALLRMPVTFWVVIFLLGAGGVYYLRRLRESMSLPMLAVLGTVTAWYVGDVFYNDYVVVFAQTFPPDILSAAWLQVAWFLLVFMFFAPKIHRRWNAKYLGRPSYAYQLFKNGVANPQFQLQINKMLVGCLLVWVVLVVIAAARVEDKIVYFFFPFLGEKADPWGRGRIGVGIDALLALAAYIQLFTGASFGVVAAVAKNLPVRMIAIIGCLLTWPYYIFDRTRNTMLAVSVPAMLMWVFLRLRLPLIVKFGVLMLLFCVVNFWMLFVIANRSDMTITSALKQKGSLTPSGEVHNEGLNMYEELCWINFLVRQGTYRINWGERYFAELVNPVPRSLWPGKPTIGLDYAVARGQGNTSADGSDANATISTGMIGQGVVNFGFILGPAVAALIMSCWIAILARLDLNGERLGRIPLFALGLILTFNLGRDITFITLYTFVFGGLLVWLADRQGRGEVQSVVAASPAELPTSKVATRRLRPLKGNRRRFGPRRRPVPDIPAV